MYITVCTTIFLFGKSKHLYNIPIIPCFLGHPKLMILLKLGLLGQPGTANAFLHQIITRLRRFGQLDLARC